MKTPTEKEYKEIMEEIKNDKKFEAIVTSLIPRSKSKRTRADRELIGLAAQIDDVRCIITSLNRRLTACLAIQAEAIEADQSCLVGLPGDVPIVLNESIASYWSYRRSLLAMIGAILEPGAMTKLNEALQERRK